MSPLRRLLAKDRPTPFARVNGQRLFYEDTGGPGPAVIFSHGLFMDHEMFARNVEDLSRRYRCITWDECGHVQTAGDSLEPFSYYDSADDLAALPAYLGVDRAVLAGMSQAGFLSMSCAMTHPDKARALIRIDTRAGIEDPIDMVGDQGLLHDWTTNGLSDEVAGIIEGIILGVNWPGAAHWEAKWGAMRAVNVAGCFAALSAATTSLHRSPPSGSRRLSSMATPMPRIHSRSPVYLWSV